MATIQQVLTPSVVTGIISRIYQPGNPLQHIFQMESGNPKIQKVEGRAYSYDIFDNIRTLPQLRMPDTPAGANAPNPIGRQPVTFARVYEKWPLDYETLNNIRALGQNAGVRDQMGASYLEQQGLKLKSKESNFREFLLGSLLTRGQASFQFSGDTMIPVMSLGANPGFTVNWQIPSGSNGNQNGSWAANLDPVGGGNIITAPWSDTATDIASCLTQINKAYQQLVGAPLGLVITDSTVWEMVIKNTALQAIGGSVNAVFADYVMEDMKGPDGNPIGVFKARLRAYPWLEWYIVDNGLVVNGAYTGWYPGNLVTFMPKPDTRWLKMVEGSELVKDNPIAPPVQRYGMWSWLREWDDPARVDLFLISNLMIELNMPNGIMIGQVN